MRRKTPIFLQRYAGPTGPTGPIGPIFPCGIRLASPDLLSYFSLRHPTGLTGPTGPTFPRTPPNILFLLKQSL